MRRVSQTSLAERIAGVGRVSSEQADWVAGQWIDVLSILEPERIEIPEGLYRQIAAGAVWLRETSFRSLWPNARAFVFAYQKAGGMPPGHYLGSLPQGRPPSDRLLELVRLCAGFWEKGTRLVPHQDMHGDFGTCFIFLLRQAGIRAGHNSSLIRRGVVTRRRMDSSWIEPSVGKRTRKSR